MRWLSLVGILAVLASALCDWLSPQLHAEESFTHFSLLTLAVGATALSGWFLHRRSILFVSALAGLTLVLLSYLHLGLIDGLFWDFVDQNRQCAAIGSFNKALYPPDNLGPLAFPVTSPVAGVSERLADSMQFFGRGWWLTLLGSALLLSGSFGQETCLRWRSLVSFAVLVFLGGVAWVGVNGQILQDDAFVALGQGRLGEAKTLFFSAMSATGQMAESEALHLGLGEVSVCQEHQDRPEAIFFLGRQRELAGDLDEAIARYKLALELSQEPLHQVVARRLALTQIKVGLKLYRQGEVGAATQLWRAALEADERQIQAAYFLARAYFDLGYYLQSIALNDQVYALSGNRQLKAMLQANIGDSYWRLELFADARKAYEASEDLVDGNVRVIKSLGGT